MRPQEGKKLFLQQMGYRMEIGSSCAAVQLCGDFGATDGSAPARRL